MLSFKNFSRVILFTLIVTKAFSQSEEVNQKRDVISKEKLDIFFKYSQDPVSVNNFLIPVNHLKSSYSTFKVESRTHNSAGWSTLNKVTDYHSDKKDKIVLNERNQISENNTYRDSVLIYKQAFEYDNNHRLIKIQEYDNSGNKSGNTTFSYNKNYSELFVIHTNKHTPSKRDTTKYFQFDNHQNPVFIKNFQGSYTIEQTIKYDDNQLISSVQAIYFHNGKVDYTVDVTYDYTYNQNEDWTELLINTVFEGKQIPMAQFYRRLEE